MTTNEKAPTLAATRAEAKKTAAFSEAVISCSHYTTDRTETQSIFELLPQGEQNAIPAATLAAIVGAASVRDLQIRIARERDNGNLILSSCKNGGGYFRPSDGADGEAEIASFVRTLRARALNTLRALRAAKAALERSELSGQLEFDNWGLEL